jgi:general stress protein 26
MPQDATRDEVIRILDGLMRDIPVAMLTTTGLGRLRSRPMVTQRAPFDGHLWFLTARAAGKTGEIRDRQLVHLTLVSPEDNRYVWATGTATLVDDQAKVQALWHPGYKPWFPNGPGDGSIALIKVRVEEAEYWDPKAGRMVLLTGFVEPGSNFRDLQPGMGI